MSWFFGFSHWGFLCGLLEILYIWLVYVLENFGRVYFLCVDFPGFLNLDCADDALDVFYLCMWYDEYRLLLWGSSCNLPLIFAVVLWEGEVGG